VLLQCGHHVSALADSSRPSLVTTTSPTDFGPSALLMSDMPVMRKQLQHAAVISPCDKPLEDGYLLQVTPV